MHGDYPCSGVLGYLVNVDSCFLIRHWKIFYSLQVPGAEGNFVFIKDAVYKKPDVSMLPFPTYFATEDEDTSELKPIVADLGEIDPFMVAD